MRECLCNRWTPRTTSGATFHDESPGRTEGIKIFRFGNFDVLLQEKTA
jgi:hypothetical protein